MRHRDDIDGLRALAVVPIVLFHAGVPGIQGGFIGVDIFFVISGFLITTIISRELREGRFTLAGFYRRRMLRILPALFVMLAVVAAVGAATLLPGETRELGKSAAAAAGFVANIFFYETVSYFAAPASARPLLHTWSLGVEEQFYILFPLLLLLLARKAPRLPLRPVLAFIAVLSFASAVLLARFDPAAAFYLLPARAWELLLGGVTALGLPAAGRATRIAAGGLGLGLIAAGYAFISSTDAIATTWLMLLPTAGTALLLAYGEATPAGRLLALPPIVAIGRLSYSLYLWHWPVIVLYRLVVAPHPGAGEIALLVAVSFGLAFLSRQLVELPFLRGFRDWSSGRVVGFGGASLALMVGAMLGVAGNAEGWRHLSPETLRIASYLDYMDTADHTYQFGVGRCFASGYNPVFDRASCLATAADRRNVVVLGDSHAAQYARAIAERFPGVNVMQATASGCKPTLPVYGQERCTRAMDYVLGPMIGSGVVDTLVIAARWQQGDVANLAHTLAIVKPSVRRIVVIGPTVEYDGSLPDLLARAMASGRTEPIRPADIAGRKAVDAALAGVAREAGVDFVSVLPIECPGDACRMTVDGIPMQFDYGHLTLQGSRYVVDRMDLGLDR